MTLHEVLSGPGDSQVVYQPNVLTPDDCRLILDELESLKDQFDGSPMLVDGQWRRITRLVLSFGDRTFRFPDMDSSLAWTPVLGRLRDRVAELTGHPFNYALVNWYINGNAETGWHADKMALHEPGSDIAILSLGAARLLRFRPLTGCGGQSELTLAEGSVLRMRGATQMHYEHCVPAMPDLAASRMSVTFRLLLDSAGRLEGPRDAR